MGSPQNYYGVGFYEGLTGGVRQTNGPTAPSAASTDQRLVRPVHEPDQRLHEQQPVRDRAPSARPRPARPRRTATSGSACRATNAIAASRCDVEAKSTDPAGCKLAVELSKDNGTTWTATNKMIDLTGSDPAVAVAARRRAERPVGRARGPRRTSPTASFLVRLRAFDPEVTNDAHEQQRDRLQQHRDRLGRRAERDRLHDDRPGQDRT